jgi:putative transcriptional regulator
MKARGPGVMRLAAACLLLAAFQAGAQQDAPPNAVLLVAKPGLLDPNFRQTVVLVTQAADGSTVGVILNRPTQAKHEKSGETVHAGGPVMPQVTVALFRTESVPQAAAFPVLKGVYLSMHPANVDALLARRDGSYRLYAGFAGWAPRQLESEMAREGWHMLPATEDVLFRKDTGKLWQELLERAQAHKTPHVQGPPRRYTFPHEGRAAQLPRLSAAGA